MKRRTFRKLPQFLSQVEEALPRAPRLLEAIAGAEFVIARSPENGMAVRGTRFRSWPVHPEPAITFKIVYSFDDREILFRALYPAVAPS
jgi:hypothetical protein